MHQPEEKIDGNKTVESKKRYAVENSFFIVELLTIFYLSVIKPQIRTIKFFHVSIYIFFRLKNKKKKRKKNKDTFYLKIPFFR